MDRHERFVVLKIQKLVSIFENVIESKTLKSLYIKIFTIYCIRSYYGPDGLDYGVGRVPIGGADFSTRPYTYDDSPTADPTLSNFNLAPEDFTYKVIK